MAVAFFRSVVTHWIRCCARGRATIHSDLDHGVTSRSPTVTAASMRTGVVVDAVTARLGPLAENEHASRTSARSAEPIEIAASVGGTNEWEPVSRPT